MILIVHPGLVCGEGLYLRSAFRVPTFWATWVQLGAPLHPALGISKCQVRKLTISDRFDSLLQSVVVGLAPHAFLYMSGDLAPSVAAVLVCSTWELRCDAVPITEASLIH